MEHRSIVENMHRLGLLRRIYVRSRTQGVDMHSGQVPLLDFILRHEGCTQAEAAAHTGVSSASVALSAKRMAAAGLIERRADEGDLRLNRLRVTEKGARAHADFMAVFGEIDALTFDGFGKEELELFSAMLRRMVDNIAGTGGEKRVGALVRKLMEIEERER